MQFNPLICLTTWSMPPNQAGDTDQVLLMVPVCAFMLYIYMMNLYGNVNKYYIVCKCHCDTLWMDRKWRAGFGQLKKGHFIFLHYFFNFSVVLFHYAHTYIHTCTNTWLCAAQRSLSLSLSPSSLSLSLSRGSRLSPFHPCYCPLKHRTLVRKILHRCRYFYHSPFLAHSQTVTRSRPRLHTHQKTSVYIKS